jgi:hypothetical protein
MALDIQNGRLFETRGVLHFEHRNKYMEGKFHI